MKTKLLIVLILLANSLFGRTEFYNINSDSSKKTNDIDVTIVPGFGCPGGIVGMKAINNNPNNPIISYLWKDTSGIILGMTDTATWVWLKIGDYPISLRVVDNIGNHQTFYETIKIRKGYFSFNKTILSSADTIKAQKYFLGEKQVLQWTHSSFGLLNSTSLDLPISDLNGITGLTEVSLIYQDDKGCFADTTLLIYILTTGIENSQTDKLKIYPNPSNQKIHINAEQKIQTIELVDLVGKRINTYSINDFQTELMIDKVPNGLYFLRAQMENGEIYFQKMLKE